MDILDSRNLEDRLVELEDEKADEGEDFGDQYELDELLQLKGNTESKGWEYGIIFIPEGEFTAYAMELAEDCYDLKTTWPYNHVDWNEAAKELLYDYYSEEYMGTTYHCRRE